MTVKDLVGFLDVSRQNLGAVLDRLEERAWIERIVDADDGRSRRIRLTAKGKGVWRDLRAPIEAFYSASLKTFGKDEQVAFSELLDRLEGCAIAGLRHANGPKLIALST